MLKMYIIQKVIEMFGKYLFLVFSNVISFILQFLKYGIFEMSTICEILHKTDIIQD